MMMVSLTKSITSDCTISSSALPNSLQQSSGDQQFATTKNGKQIARRSIL